MRSVVTSKPSLIAIFLLIIGGLIVISNILSVVVDVRALAVGFEIQLVGLALIVVAKYK